MRPKQVFLIATGFLGLAFVALLGAPHTALSGAVGATRCGLDYFGADKPLNGITPGDADKFRLHLSRTMAEALAWNGCARKSSSVD